MALISGRAIKTSLGFHVVADTGASAGTGGVACPASWPLTAGLLVSAEALLTAWRGAACFLLRWYPELPLSLRRVVSVLTATASVTTVRDRKH